VKSGKRQSGAGRADAKQPRRRAPAAAKTETPPTPTARPLKVGDSVYVTLRALSAGVERVVVRRILLGGYVLCDGFPRALKLDACCWSDRDLAISRAKSLKAAQLERLRRQVAALEAVDFDRTPA
jgi:hypothetical protein